MAPGVVARAHNGRAARRGARTTMVTYDCIRARGAAAPAAGRRRRGRGRTDRSGYFGKVQPLVPAASQHASQAARSSQAYAGLRDRPRLVAAAGVAVAGPVAREIIMVMRWPWPRGVQLADRSSSSSSSSLSSSTWPMEPRSSSSGPSLCRAVLAVLTASESRLSLLRPERVDSGRCEKPGRPSRRRMDSTRVSRASRASSWQRIHWSPGILFLKDTRRAWSVVSRSTMWGSKFCTSLEVAFGPGSTSRSPFQ
mmetsp:Transcript_3537/g.10893  ORF Transcript_3537/g.10893 Transcript_3537/m.10893 type:complete len:253 (+) Transcript_3537:1075-1833(+)